MEPGLLKWWGCQVRAERKTNVTKTLVLMDEYDGHLFAFFDNLCCLRVTALWHKAVSEHFPTKVFIFLMKTRPPETGGLCFWGFENLVLADKVN